LVADIIRGLPVQEAEVQLMLTPKRAGVHLLKLLRSAVDNAEKDMEMNPKLLYIKEIRVDEGPTLKRWRPRAFGVVRQINKRTSHTTLVLEELEGKRAERFVIPEKPKKPSAEERKKEKEKEKKKKPEARPEIKPKMEAEKPKESRNPFRRIFRRKSI
jgi:large subunit ribosomal protein L22